MISRLLTLIIFPSVVYFPCCVICCNLDSQITPSAEDLQSSTNCLTMLKTKLIVNHPSFGSYKTKEVKSSPSIPLESCLIAKTITDFTFAFIEALPIIIALSAIKNNIHLHGPQQALLPECLWKQFPIQKGIFFLLKNGSMVN